MLDPSWEPPSFRERERSYWWVWLIILILIIGVVVYYFVQKPAVVAQKVGKIEAPTESSAVIKQETTPIVLSTTPEFSEKCNALLGFVPGSGRFDKETKILRVMLKNNGKVSAEGTYFEFINPSKSIFKKNQDVLEPGAEKTYDVQFTQIASELGLASVKSFYIYPIQDGKACSNQKLIVFNTE